MREQLANTVEHLAAKAWEEVETKNRADTEGILDQLSVTLETDHMSDVVFTIPQVANKKKINSFRFKYFAPGVAVSDKSGPIEHAQKSRPQASGAETSFRTNSDCM